jgi:hypothetical protein
VDSFNEHIHRHRHRICDSEHGGIVSRADAYVRR